MENNWWLREDIEWSNIGVDVVSRPTEIEALNNISQQAKHLRLVGYDFESIKLTSLEKKLFELELFVTSEDFDAKSHHSIKIKDSTIRRISKLTDYSESFIMRKLTNMTRKIWLGEVFHIDVFLEKEKPSERIRRNKLTKKWNEYNAKYKRVA